MRRHLSNKVELLLLCFSPVSLACRRPGAEALLSAGRRRVSWAQPPSLAGGGRSATGDTSIQDGGGGGLSAETLHTALQPGA